MRSFTSLTIFLLFFLSKSTKAQESILCKNFKSGKTQSIDLTFNSYTDIAMVQHLADYYSGLRWEEKEENGIKVLKRTKKHFPRAGSKNIVLKRPVATTSLIQEHFPKSYMKNLGKCSKNYRTAYGQRGKPPRSMTTAYQNFIDKDNRYFKKIAQDCSDAANAIRQWETRSAALLRDMRSHCINESNKNKSKDTKNTSTIKFTNNKSSTNNGSSTNKATSNSTKKISYKKAKSSVKSSKIYPKGNFTPIPSNATQMQIQQYQQNMKRQWNALNQSERRLSQLFENIFWKDYRAEQAKEERKAKKEAKEAKSFQIRKFSNYINNWASYTSSISNWLTEYATYVPNSVINIVEKDLLRAKNNIRDIIRVRMDFMRKTKNYDDSYAIDSYANNIWNDFNKKYGRKIKQGRFSALSELRSNVRKNPSPQNKSMLADYAYIGYNHAKRYKMDSNSYARFIVEFFHDYPQINTMRSELEAERKASEERRRLSQIRISLGKIHTYSVLKKPSQLNAFIDSLINTSSQSKYQEALLSKKGNSSILSQLYRSGYREEFLKLSNWLNIKNYNQSDLSMMTIKALILSPNKESYSNLKYGFYSMMNSGFPELYKPKKLSFYSAAHYKALLNFSQENIKQVYSKAKSYNRGKGVYGIRQDITRVLAGAYDAMLYFKLEDYKYFIKKNKKDSFKYFLGIWTKPTDNWRSLEVTYVSENSPAYKNGVEVGDKIIRIGNRGVTGYNYEGSPSPVYDGKENSWFELLKQDGKVYRMKVPIRITKENIKTGFLGESKLISNSKNLPYFQENKNTLVFNGKKKFANNSAQTPAYWGYNGFKTLSNGYIGASFKMEGPNAKAALSIDGSERKYIKNGKSTELSFWINDLGQFKIDNSKEKYSTNWIKSDAIKNGLSNLLSITKLGNRLQFFINGAFVYEISSYSSTLNSYCILAWNRTSITQDYLHAYNTSEDEIRSIMVENPPLLLDNVIIDESFELSNKSKYKYFYEKNSNWNNLRLTNAQIQHRFVGNWTSNYLELYDKKRLNATTIGNLTGKVFSGSFELSFEFQHSPSNNTDKAFFINFKKEGVYDKVKKKWDYENHYQWSWVAIRPSSTFLGQKLGGRNKPTENLPSKRIKSVKGKFHSFKAIYNNDILKVFLNGEKIGEIKMRKGTTFWDIFEPRSNGLRIKNLKVISGR